jgi:acetone carboxylase gamma subunit
MQILKYLELDESEHTISCRECGETLCDADENYKKYSAQRTGPVTDAGPAFEPPEKILGADVDIEFRQYFCPNCAVLFDHQFARGDDPIIHDIEIDLDSLSA